MKENAYVMNAKMPFCKGCGHATALADLVESLSVLKVDPSRLVLVSDIGCVGLADALFKTHTVHTLHGRSTAVATGIMLSTGIEDRHNLETVVLLGDGGATIGLLHLVEAARLNVDITVLVQNNFLYGMTGGQHSGLTPARFKTRTTPEGCAYPALDICAVLATAGASFVARGIAGNKETRQLIRQGLDHRGFSVIEVLELCTGFATRYNTLNAKRLKEIAGEQGFALGLLTRTSRAVNRASAKQGPFDLFEKIDVRFQHHLNHSKSVIIAGSAGSGVQFAASALAYAAAASGLRVTQKNDNPVTVGTGFSSSELIFSDREICYTGIDAPDYLILTSDEGYTRMKRKIALLEKGCILADASLAVQVPVPVITYPFRRFRGVKSGVNVSAVSFLLQHDPFLEVDAFIEALQPSPNAGDLIEIVHSIAAPLPESYAVC